ncbi:hypothetical protein CZP2022_211 [Vibrio phage C-ZP2022]|nr:hypothetical protein CZP2022_211 [Vibrio phage C-ZP2022]
MPNPTMAVTYSLHPVACWLQFQLSLVMNELESEEVHYSDCADIVRDMFQSYIAGMDVVEETYPANNMLYTEFEYLKLTPQHAVWLAKGIVGMFSGIVANTIRTIDQREFQVVNMISDTDFVIEQTVNQAYQNDVIHQVQTQITAEEVQARYV